MWEDGWDEFDVGPLVKKESPLPLSFGVDFS